MVWFILLLVSGFIAGRYSGIMASKCNVPWYSFIWLYILGLVMGFISVYWGGEL